MPTNLAIHTHSLRVLILKTNDVLLINVILIPVANKGLTSPTDVTQV